MFNLFFLFLKLVSLYAREFWVYEIGQIICAFSECFYLSLAPEVAALWFPVEEVAMATSFGVLANHLGIAISFIIPPYVVRGVKSGNHSRSYIPHNGFDGNQDSSYAYICIRAYVIIHQ